MHMAQYGGKSINTYCTHGDHMNNVEQKQNNRNKINGKMIDKSIILVLQFETLIVRRRGPTLYKHQITYTSFQGGPPLKTHQSTY